MSKTLSINTPGEADQEYLGRTGNRYFAARFEVKGGDLTVAARKGQCLITIRNKENHIEHMNLIPVVVPGNYGFQARIKDRREAENYTGASMTPQMCTAISKLLKPFIAINPEHPHDLYRLQQFRRGHGVWSEESGLRRFSIAKSCNLVIKSRA
jgi:hypothetical protein